MEETNEPIGPKAMDHKPIVGAILVVGLMIAGAILIRGSERPVAQNNNAAPLPSDIGIQIRPIAKNEHILGNTNADIFIVEYSDTECPFCKNFHSTMHQVVAQSGGKVAWVYRHLPIPQLHQKAEFEANATECAWEQGGNDAFWDYINQVFARTNSNDSLPTSELSVIASDLGLDTAKFEECLNSQKYATKVASDVTDAKRAGIRGTPSSFIVIDGKVVDEIGGAQPLSVVLAQIEAAKQ